MNLRLQPDDLAAIDALIASRPDPKPSRPEAIRQIVRVALKLIKDPEGAK